MRFALKRGPEKLFVEVAGREVPVRVNRNPRARRLILRIDAASGLPVVTLPPRTALAQGEAFLLNHVGWLEGRLGCAASAIAFSDGSSFPLRGEPCRIVHRGERGLVRLEPQSGEALLSVPGEAAHLPRRVMDWLKREARRDFEASVGRHNAAIGTRHTGLRIGDAKTRWGSCTAEGVLTFSWRLILAPPNVLDYLAAHEVAHLVEMNHGARFWALLRRLDPHLDAPRAWLKANGAALHSVGRAPASG